MRNSKDTFYLFIILIGVIWFSEAQSSPFKSNKFQVSIKAERSDLEYVQLKADYRTLKKSRYCKGAFISDASGKWECDQGSMQKCSKKYQCKRVNRTFNIKTESQRIRKAMAQTGMIKPGRHKIWVSRKPKKNKSNQKKIAKSISPKNFSGVQYLGTGPIRGQVFDGSEEQRQAYIEKQKMTASEFKEQANQKEALDELKAEAQEKVDKKIAAKGFKKAERVEETTKADEAMSELDETDDSEYQEAMDIAEDSSESDIELDMDEEGDADIAASEGSSDDEGSNSGESMFKFLAFSGGFVSISTIEQSISTLEVAWTPRMTFGAGSTFGIRGHYGFHQYTIPATSLLTEEIIAIIDMKAMLFKYFGNFVLEAGVGVQSWGGTVGQSFSTISGTLGYKFDVPVMKAVDRLYVHYMQIAAAEPATSMEFGIGISF